MDFGLGALAEWYLENLNYGTVTLLMGIESSFIPFPSEVVIPPAAWKAAQIDGGMNVYMVLLFATLGSLLGALVNYVLAYLLGRPIVYSFANSRWGHLCLIDEAKVKKAEAYFDKHGSMATLIGRFIPAIRQLISIPAGLARMNLLKFMSFTFIGAGIWNAVLVGLGYAIAKANPDMTMDQLESTVGLYSAEIGYVLIGALGVLAICLFIKYLKKKDKKMKHFGIIGYPLSSSFSQKFFNEKFAKENIDAFYDLHPIEDIEKFRDLVTEIDFCGMNVTIPYKQQVIPFLNSLDETAEQIGAVNVIKFVRKDGQQTLTGYNTDAIGFENSLKPLLKPWHTKALVLGTGGASKAVAYVLKKNGIDFRFVSRTPKNGQFSYEDINADIMAEYTLIVNCTPLGMYPVDACPDIPYECITDKHLLYDLIYNPAKTLFLEKGEKQGATIKNGLEMLHGQAVAAWKIWNE